jgi:hypothetical protein
LLAVVVILGGHALWLLVLGTLTKRKNESVLRLIRSAI